MLVGTFSETHYKKGVKHEAFPPSSVTAGSIGGTGVLVASQSTPLVGAVHDLIGSGARYAMLLREGAEGSDEAAGGVVRMPSVRREDVQAVVSVRDLVRQAARVRTAAGKAADEASARAAAGEAELSAVADATRRLLGKESAALDARAFGRAIPDAAAALGALMEAGNREAYINCSSGDRKTTAAAAMGSMAKNAVSAVILLDDAAALAGLFTVRDYLWKVVAPAGDGGPVDATKAPVSDLMTTDLRLAGFDWAIERCARVMCKRGMTHLPLTDDGTFVGLLSLADVARFMVKAPFPRAGDAADPDADLRADAIEHFARLEAAAVALAPRAAAPLTEEDAPAPERAN